MEKSLLQKTMITAVFAFCIFALWEAWAEKSTQAMEMGTVSFIEQGLELQVEIAETAKQRAVGLMYRESLALEVGMLFIFDQEAEQRVWMKNTLLTLDIVFLSSNGKIVSMLQHLKPCEQMTCRIYSSKIKAKYMLEMNAGILETVELKVGQSFVFKR